jgi:Alpha/beta hydrolase family
LGWRIVRRYVMALPSIPGCGVEWEDSCWDNPSSLNSTYCAVKQTLAVIGHSFGGLLTQILAGRGLAEVSVAIDPAPFRGVLPLPISALKSGSPVLHNPGQPQPGGAADLCSRPVVRRSLVGRKEKGWMRTSPSRGTSGRCSATAM